MLTKDMSRSEIEREIRGKGDFVQIDYLNRFLLQKPPLHEKKYAFMKLIEIYEGKKMFNDVAKIYSNLVILATSQAEKTDALIKQAKANVQASNFEEADTIMRKAMEEVSIIKKTEIYEDIKKFYKQQAEIYEKENKRNHAVKVYEKMLGLKISDEERKEVKGKLLDLYDKLGKFRESSVLDHKRFG